MVLEILIILFILNELHNHRILYIHYQYIILKFQGFMVKCH